MGITKAPYLLEAAAESICSGHGLFEPCDGVTVTGTCRTTGGKSHAPLHYQSTAGKPPTHASGAACDRLILPSKS